MTTEELLKQQKVLQQEARQVLDKLQILDILSEFGKPKIVGSFYTGLMTWRDIDIELEQEIKDEWYWKTVNKLFYDQSDLKYLTLINFKNSKNPITPKGLYAGIKYWHEDKEWKIDVWFMPPRPEDSEDMSEWVKNKLTNENRISILRIKNQVHMNPKYRKEIFSTDIYRAVIDKGIHDLGGFKAYLNEQGKSL